MTRRSRHQLLTALLAGLTALTGAVHLFPERYQHWVLLAGIFCATVSATLTPGRSKPTTKPAKRL